MDIKWIALYLSGQYPGYYRLPNRLDLVLEIRQLDMTNFSDTMLSLLNGKGDLEYYSSLLETFKKLHPDKIQILLERLDIPREVGADPHEINSSPTSSYLDKIKNYLESVNETDFSRHIVMPILHEMGYKMIEYKGKVTESDGGIDFYVAYYSSPSGLNYYTGIQVKSVKMSNGSSTKPGSELQKLIQEVKTAFSGSHLGYDGSMVKIDEMLIFNSRHTHESVKKAFYESEDFQSRKIRFYGIDGVISLIHQLNLDQLI